MFGLCFLCCPFLKKFFQYPEILKNFSKNVSKIGENLNLAPKLKKRFSARQASFISVLTTRDIIGRPNKDNNIFSSDFQPYIKNCMLNNVISVSESAIKFTEIRKKAEHKNIAGRL